MVTDSDAASGSRETPKLRTACENCRQSKVKCNVSEKDTCIRCLRHGLPCRYRVANRSGKPKGSKNRSTLRKLDQLQENKPAAIPDYHPGSRRIEAIPSPRLPDTPMGEMPDTPMLPADCAEYPSLYGDSMGDSPSAQASMSPTFLQKEFITKGLTSCPLAVHIPNTLQPACDCSETLVFHHDHLRQMAVNPAQLRFDQMLQGVQTALSVCRGFLQCPSGHREGHNNTAGASLNLCMPTLELTLQILDYWTSYELLPQFREALPRETVGFGEYAMGPDETRRVRRFLIRGRLLHCKETLGLLKSVADSENAVGMGGSWLQQRIGGTEAMTDTFLHAMSEADSINAHLNFPRGLLAGQVAIITGAGQGIGAEAARLFANEGAKVVVADIDGEKANSVVNAINSAEPNRAIAVVGDILDDKYLQELVDKAAAFGNGKIHIIVNNAGFTWDGVIHKITDKQWDTMIAVHNTAPFKLIRAAAKYFRVKDKEPRVIINISSTSGIHGNAGQANYALAKAGVVGLTRTIAKEWGPQFGVRSNTIAFGFVQTRLTAAKEAGAFITTPDGTKVALGIPGQQLGAKKGGEAATYPDIPLGRPASPEEAARSVLAVASPLFSYVNGETIRVTGGRNM
ncbi:3-oxoacyl-reductase [Aspergillus granulosus]|uniref:3-oxoacyl-reductase n=1 Tax=Aspergillus granulosus TaxID=176169 RepID=A0ABR4H5N2_9EURO